MNSTSVDTILYLLISLVTLIKLTAVITASKHDLINSSFIGYMMIESVGWLGFSALLIFVLLVISIIAQFLNKTKQNLLLLITLLFLSSILLYNLGTLKAF